MATRRRRRRCRLRTAVDHVDDGRGWLFATLGVGPQDVERLHAPLELHPQDRHRDDDTGGEDEADHDAREDVLAVHGGMLLPALACRRPRAAVFSARLPLVAGTDAAAAEKTSRGPLVGMKPMAVGASVLAAQRPLKSCASRERPGRGTQPASLRGYMTDLALPCT
jgi:hypothetical protein